MRELVLGANMYFRTEVVSIPDVDLIAFNNKINVFGKTRCQTNIYCVFFRTVRISVERPLTMHDATYKESVLISELGNEFNGFLLRVAFDRYTEFIPGWQREFRSHHRSYFGRSECTYCDTTGILSDLQIFGDRDSASEANTCSFRVFLYDLS